MQKNLKSESEKKKNLILSISVGSIKFNIWFPMQLTSMAKNICSSVEQKSFRSQKKKCKHLF